MGAKFAIDRSRRRPSANALDAAYTKQAKPMGFACMITFGEGVMA